MPNKSRYYYTLMVMFLLLSLCGTLPADEPQTGAELSQYQKTSTYDEVIDFIFNCQKRSPRIHVQHLLTSPEGRMVPLVTVSLEGVRTVRELRIAQKPAVLIVANIHAGEVEGKEAVLMLLREFAVGGFSEVLENQVVLLIPIMNADGNEKFGKNRGDDGPELAGVRYNGQYLDLNRDALKLESPEQRGVIRLLNEWDPVIYVDMHTTNGSWHQIPVTYTTMLTPNSDPRLADYMWKKFFPAVADTLKKTFGYNSIPYGNFADRINPEKGWISDSIGHRYGSNYFGLRNRFSILDENYSHADFKTRVLSSLGFIKSILIHSNRYIREMEALAKDADKSTISTFHTVNFALEYTTEKLFEMDVKSYKFETEKIKKEDLHKYPPWLEGVLVKKTAETKTYHVNYMAKPVAVRSVTLPEAYIILPFHDDIIERLKHHGIQVERILKPFTAKVENFVIREIKPEPRIYQGHVAITITGDYQELETTIPANSSFISMKQPLARLIPVLLEPGCDDSLIRWGFFNREIVSQWSAKPSLYQVYRLKQVTHPIERISPEPR